MTSDADAAAILASALEAVPVLSAIKPIGLPQIRLELRTALESGQMAIPAWQYNPPAVAGAFDELTRAESALASTNLDPQLCAAAEEAIERARTAALALTKNDDEGFSQWSRTDYGEPTSETVALALEILSTEPTPDESPNIDSGTAADVFRQILKGIGLTEWKVVIVPEMAARVSVKSAEKLVRLEAASSFSVATLPRLVAHEICGHALRTYNAGQQSTGFAALSLGDTTKTEEGLATWVEDYLGVQRLADRQLYALRVVAVDLSARLGIVELTRELQNWIEPDLAVATAIRVKRGLRDPNAAGGFTKDHVYLQGLIDVTNFLRDNPAELAPLFSTKWSLDRMPLVHRLLDVGTLSTDDLTLPGIEHLSPLDKFAHHRP